MIAKILFWVIAISISNCGTNHEVRTNELDSKEENSTYEDSVIELAGPQQISHSNSPASTKPISTIVLSCQAPDKLYLQPVPKVETKPGLLITHSESMCIAPERCVVTSSESYIHFPKVSPRLNYTCNCIFGAPATTWVAGIPTTSCAPVSKIPAVPNSTTGSKSEPTTIVPTYTTKLN